MSDDVLKVVRDGMVAVLYSPGHSQGWFSLNQECPECLFHPEVVECVLAGGQPSIEMCRRLFGDGFDTGGADDLRVEWLKQGTRFRIHEYDGHETVVTYDDSEALRAQLMQIAARLEASSDVAMDRAAASLSNPRAVGRPEYEISRFEESFALGWLDGETKTAASAIRAMVDVYLPDQPAKRGRR